MNKKKQIQLLEGDLKNLRAELDVVIREGRVNSTVGRRIQEKREELKKVMESEKD